MRHEQRENNLIMYTKHRNNFILTNENPRRHNTFLVRQVKLYLIAS